MPELQDRTHYVVEAARRRVVASARDAGRARAMAAVLLFGRALAPERDQLVVREPEEERAAVDRRAMQGRQPRTKPLKPLIPREDPAGRGAFRRRRQKARQKVNS